MKKLLPTMVLIVLALLLARPGWSLAQGTDPASVMAAFSTAAPNPDVQILLVADDVTISLPDGRVWAGKEQAGQFLTFMKEINVRRELVGNWQVAGNKVSGTVLVTNKNFDAWNLGQVEHILEGVVENGKLTAWTSFVSPAEQPRFAAAVEAAQTPQVMPATGEAATTQVHVWLSALAGLILVLGLALRRARVQTQ